MKNIENIGLFGSAKDEIDSSYIKAVEQFGEIMASAGTTLYFGAGATGLMGAAARGYTKGDGRIVGVAPEFMDRFEPLYDKCDSLIITKTMEERKIIIKDSSDAFVICPGGIGTLDEFFEVVTDKYLKLHNKPIILLNINGFFDKAVELIYNYVDLGFIGERVKDMFLIANSVSEAYNLLVKES